MTFRKYLKVGEKFVTDNSPAILTGAGVAGTVLTAYLTGKATVKAERILREDAFEKQTDVFFQHDIRDRFQMTWQLYLPAVFTGAATVVCVVGANRIGTRRTAAMAAAYTISDKAFAEYKEKVVERLGANKEQKVRDDIQEDRVKAQTSNVIVTGDGNVMCYDSFSGRYFESKMEDLKWAQNNINHKIINDYYASLGDFYGLVGLPATAYSEEVGWNCDELLELQFSTVMSDDQKPCIAIDFRVSPIRNYYRIN